MIRLGLQAFLGESSAAAAVREQIEDFLARHGTECPPPSILLRGELGVGKSLLARLIHRAGPRPDGAFVEFHCHAIPAHLVESELFGLDPGAFTGPRHAKPGAFQAADHGTLFLNGLRDLPPGLAPVLLRVLESRSVRRVGSTRDEPVDDVWIIAATSEDPREAAHYLRDLYQHLGQLDLLIPPLRQRPEDILLLAEHFLARVCTDYNLPPKVFTADARRELLAYNWPGNAMRVKYLAERVALFSSEDLITAAMLPRPI